jgi:type I restriction enzyme R subunit
MEHAIRKHCKVHWGEDPALYQLLSEKLESLIKKHKDNWDQLRLDLTALRDEVIEPVKPGTDGANPKEAPFYRLVLMVAFGSREVTDQQKQQIKQMVSEAFILIKERISIINFWKSGYEIDSMKGELSDLLLMTNIDEIISTEEKLVTELTALAKARHKDILA